MIKINIKIIIKSFMAIVISFAISFAFINKEIVGHNYYTTINATEINDLMSANKNIIIYFYKENCSPCSKFKITLNNYIKKHDTKVYAVNINNDKDNYFDLSDKYKLKYTPTVISFQNAKESKRIEGLVSDKEFYKFMKNSK